MYILRDSRAIKNELEESASAINTTDLNLSENSEPSSAPSALMTNASETITSSVVEPRIESFALDSSHMIRHESDAKVLACFPTLRRLIPCHWWDSISVPQCQDRHDTESVDGFSPKVQKVVFRASPLIFDFLQGRHD